jgi:hypothetical protein
MKDPSKLTTRDGISKLVAKIHTTRNDVARFKLVQELCDGADDARLTAIDAAFRQDRKRLPSYPFVLGVLLDGGVSRAKSVLAELVENADEAVAASALEVVGAKQLADGLLDIIVPMAAEGRLGLRRAAAIKALASSRTRKATVALVELSTQGRLPEAHRNIVFGGLALSDQPEAVSAMRRAFEDPGEHPVVRAYAAYGVARAGDVRGLYALRSNLELSAPGTVIQTVVQSVMALHELVAIPEKIGSGAVGAAGPALVRLQKDWPQVVEAYEKRWPSRGSKS